MDDQSLGHDALSESHRRTCDLSDPGMPTVAVVESVAAVRGVEESALPPLGGHVDPDSLNRLFDDRQDDSSARVEFTYAGCDVRVESDGTIGVRPAGDV